MIEILNKLINIIVGTSNENFILNLHGMKLSYINYIRQYHEEMQAIISEWYLNPEQIKIFNFKLFLQWFFSSPEIIISFIFYFLMAWSIFYFFIIVPFRLIKQLLPKSVRTRKGTNKA